MHLQGPAHELGGGESEEEDAETEDAGRGLLWCEQRGDSREHNGKDGLHRSDGGRAESADREVRPLPAAQLQQPPKADFDGLLLISLQGRRSRPSWLGLV